MRRRGNKHFQAGPSKYYPLTKRNTESFFTLLFSILISPALPLVFCTTLRILFIRLFGLFVRVFVVCLLDSPLGSFRLFRILFRVYYVRKIASTWCSLYTHKLDFCPSPPFDHPPLSLILFFFFCIIRWLFMTTIDNNRAKRDPQQKRNTSRGICLSRPRPKCSPV